MAKARVDVSFKFNVFKFFLFIPMIWLGAKIGGGTGAALGFLLVQVINTCLSYFILIKPVLGSSYREYIMSILLPLKMTLPTMLAAWLAGLFSLSGSPLITLVIQILVGIVTFSMTLIFSNNQFVSEMKCYIVKNPKVRKFIRA